MCYLFNLNYFNHSYHFYNFFCFFYLISTYQESQLIVFTQFLSFFQHFFQAVQNQFHFNLLMLHRHRFHQCLYFCFAIVYFFQSLFEFLNQIFDYQSEFYKLHDQQKSVKIYLYHIFANQFINLKILGLLVHLDIQFPNFFIHFLISIYLLGLFIFFQVMQNLQFTDQQHGLSCNQTQFQEQNYILEGPKCNYLSSNLHRNLLNQQYSQQFFLI
ncbi:transmembrane protein, putative (macronuclear) [Tetrahymena thermophila SB210]|uniref:Transmembrane protein, putative n=1 Tax=Tetrahymena thermophila (strain SB210) TaxID=312017 RepID=W7WX09_TETTS|nr:transmembrane protein, putative [Tetrahymena thermophila SB210]EWS71325.1 transmembrane protein, putative [Tetrahymena thermophila SB210]|eukprot:XP_012656143.1 transmembrane protein, putative [Tetrahymena thermophila SB210]